MHADSFIVHAKTDDITKILQKMLKQDLTFQILKWTDHYLKEKQKSNWANERLIRRINCKRICRIKGKNI